MFSSPSSSDRPFLNGGLMHNRFVGVRRYRLARPLVSRSQFVTATRKLSQQFRLTDH